MPETAILKKTQQKCLLLDREFAEKQLAKTKPWLHIIREIPAPFTKGRFHFNTSLFIASDLKTKISVFHIKPVYYATTKLKMRPLEEICEYHGNRNIILKRNPLEMNIHLGYLGWLMKRQVLLGSYLRWRGGSRFPVLLAVVSDFFPDPDPESTSVDGMAGRRAQDEAFGTIRSGAGTAADSAPIIMALWIEASTTSNQYRDILRNIVLFDTSSIPDGDTIDSATLGAVGDEKEAGLGSLNWTLDTSSPASNTDIVTADYNIANWGGVRQATDITYANWTVGSYNNFTLNATGLGNISKTGISKFGFRIANDFDNSAPTWSSAAISRLTSRSADQTGTANDPKLSVTHTAAVAGMDLRPLLGVG